MSNGTRPGVVPARLAAGSAWVNGLGEPPADVLSWVARNSTPLSALADATVARQVLHQATGRLDRKIAAASTARRHRTILANAAPDSGPLVRVRTGLACWSWHAHG